jgi:L-ascorbate metabolism protein UlaG (beta-lactamase superfamily)
MIINYYGHACFKLRGTEGTVITDPFGDYVGFEFPNLSADIVTVSHDNPAHNNYKAVSGTTRRDNPFIIDHPGEYEVQSVSVFGVKTYQDKQQGAVRGENYIFTILSDNLRVCHLGALAHPLEDRTVSEIGLVDILFLPVGNAHTLNPKEAVRVARSLEPNIVIPMLYKTKDHNQDVFKDLQGLDEFLKAYEAEPQAIDKLNISRSNLPEEMELVVLNQT